MDSYDKAKGAEEHILDLGGSRQLSYAHNGPSASRVVVLTFTGLMSVASTPDVPEPCRELGAHYIHATLPGMGKSSARAAGEEYHVALAQDIAALLDHLYPAGEFDTLYIAGGSYGTVQAQMLYGAPYSLFPAGRKIAGCLLLAGFSPFKYHTDHAKTLTWHSWFTLGPPSQLIPFHILQRSVSTILSAKLKTVEGAKGFFNSFVIARMDSDERKRFAQFLDEKGRTEEEFVDMMGRAIFRCCEQWGGFHEVSDVLHSDWGFEPATLDEEHSSKPMLIAGSDADPQGGSTNGWLGENYKSARVKTVPGGHLSTAYYLDELWRELLAMGSSQG